MFISFILLILQIIVPPDFIFGVKPDFLLILAVIAGLLSGVKYGAGVGFITGSLQDLFLGGFFGIFSIIKVVVASLAGLVEGTLFKERLFIPPLVIFIATIIHEFLVIILSEQLLFNVNIINALKTSILPEAIVNGLLGYLFYLILFKLIRPGGRYYG